MSMEKEHKNSCSCCSLRRVDRRTLEAAGRRVEFAGLSYHTRMILGYIVSCPKARCSTLVQLTFDRMVLHDVRRLPWQAGVMRRAISAQYWARRARRQVAGQLLGPLGRYQPLERIAMNQLGGKTLPHCPIVGPCALACVCACWAQFISWLLLYT